MPFYISHFQLSKRGKTFLKNFHFPKYFSSSRDCEYPAPRIWVSYTKEAVLKGCFPLTFAVLSYSKTDLKKIMHNSKIYFLAWSSSQLWRKVFECKIICIFRHFRQKFGTHSLSQNFCCVSSRLSHMLITSHLFFYCGCQLQFLAMVVVAHKRGFIVYRCLTWIPK